MINSEPLTQTQQESLETCFTSEQKELLEQAAQIEGITLTDFVVKSAQSHAYQVIAEFNCIQLSPRDSKDFAESLLNPPEPSPSMIEKAAKYKKAMGLE